MCARVRATSTMYEHKPGNRFEFALSVVRSETNINCPQMDDYLVSFYLKKVSCVIVSSEIYHLYFQYIKKNVFARKLYSISFWVHVSFILSQFFSTSIRYRLESQIQLPTIRIRLLVYSISIQFSLNHKS